jgi:glycosyltransferase involved in cell wall biosynthesis
MRVLILSHYDRLSPRIEQEIQALSAEGYQIHMVSWARVCETDSSMMLADVSREKVRYPAPRGTLELLFYLPGLYLKIFNKLKGKSFEIVHCTHIMLLPAAVLWGRWRKARIIYDVYEFHLQETAERLPKLLRWLVPLLRRVEAHLVQSVDGVLTIDSADNQLERYYRRFNGNVSVLYNVPDLSYSLDERKLKYLKCRYQNKKIVLYIGGLSIVKGALQAIEAAKLVVQRVPEAFFLFVGMFHGETEAVFWERVAATMMEKKVEFIPWLPYNEMLHYVAVSKVGLALHQPVPRYHLLGRGNGRKIFTYMQFGIPIVAPMFGEVGQIVQEEECGILVDTTDPQQIANAIIYLLEHPEEARAMGKRGRKAIEEKYNWEIEKKKLLKVYQRAGGKNNG